MSDKNPDPSKNRGDDKSAPDASEHPMEDNRLGDPNINTEENDQLPGAKKHNRKDAFAEQVIKEVEQKDRSQRDAADKL